MLRASEPLPGRTCRPRPAGRTAGASRARPLPAGPCGAWAGVSPGPEPFGGDRAERLAPSLRPRPPRGARQRLSCLRPAASLPPASHQAREPTASGRGDAGGHVVPAPLSGSLIASPSVPGRKVASSTRCSSANIYRFPTEWQALRARGHRAAPAGPPGRLPHCVLPLGVGTDPCARIRPFLHECRPS